MSGWMAIILICVVALGVVAVLYKYARRHQ